MASLWMPCGWLWCSVSCADPWVERLISAWLHPQSTTSWHGSCCYSNRRDPEVQCLCPLEDRRLNWAQFTWNGWENGKFLNYVNHTHNGYITGEERNLLGCPSGFMVEGRTAVFCPIPQFPLTPRVYKIYSENTRERNTKWENMNKWVSQGKGGGDV